MTAAFARLAAALADRYRLERELGQGGMATVYLAQDLKHHRQVALKVLRPELAAVLGHERFLREITTTASLRHPHILPLYDSGGVEAGSETLLYYVMPYVEGESLRNRLDRETQLSLADVVQITREVADALGYAHSQGIVHRDIKPGNILLEHGHALVADFGIAKAVSAAGGETLTETGFAVGTAAYMSPEQWAAQPVDARSDLYSLACVTYEMLVGHGPFYGATAQELRARHTSDPVPALRPARASVSVSMEHAITKALAKVPADRFSSVWAFAEALAGPAPPPPVPRPWRRWAWPVAALLGVTGVAAMFALVPRHAPPTVAVLPPALLDTTEASWFADGMAEEIANRLTNVSGLSVIGPRSSTAQRLASAGASERRLGREVQVPYVLQVAIRSDQAPRGPRQVRVSLQLVRLRDHTNIWAHSYTNTLTGGAVFDLQASIAEQVAQALDVKLLAGEDVALRAQPTQNPAAYEAFLQGKAYSGGYGEAFTTEDRPAAVEAYLRATRLDSTFAEAQARLAIQYAALGEDSLARQRAERALTLAPNLAWAHLALAECEFRTGNWERFRTEAAAAERLAPNSSEILERTAVRYGQLDEFDHMQRNYERAFALDPLNWHAALDLGVILFAVRRHAEAERYLDRAITLDDTVPDPYMYKAWLYLAWHGNLSEPRAVLQQAVARLGARRAFAVGFLSSHWWASRLLGRDTWYRGMLERTTLGTAGLDSGNYYMHKAGLYEGLGQRARARTYWDSAATVLEGRVRVLTSAGRSDSTAPMAPGAGQTGPAIAGVLGSLAVAHAAAGRSDLALEEAGRSVEALPSIQWQATTLSLVNAELGRNEAAAEQFARLLQVPGWVTPQFLSLDPTLTPLRAVTRFRALLQGR